MPATNSYLLTITLLMPLLGALSMALIKSDKPRFYHWLAAFWSGLTLILSLVVAGAYNRTLHSPGQYVFQFVDRLDWMPLFKIQYQVGVDGLSLPMVVLTALIVFVAVFVSWKIDTRPRLYFSMLLLMETGVLGVFTSLDLFLFFVMWELELIPMYFLIGLWGGPRREYAAIKFILYTMLASALMLLAFLAIYFLSEVRTFDVITLLQNQNALLAGLSQPLQIGLFLCLFVAFAVKLPMVPFHTWLPDAHVEAPTAISVVLAGVLLKMGAYGMMRFNLGFFPDLTQWLAAGLAVLGMINILYGALLALAQTDMKRVIAYSSVSHMGFVLLGMAAWNTTGLNGAMLQMFTHGTITALLFIFVGVVYDRTHTRELSQLGGLVTRMPLAAALFVVSALASVGAPGMSGFVSEFLIFTGSYGNALKGVPHFVVQLATIAAAIGIILGAAYTLWLIRRVFFGPMAERWMGLEDIDAIELSTVAVLLALVFALGFYPALLVDYLNPAAEQLLTVMPQAEQMPPGLDLQLQSQMGGHAGHSHEGGHGH
ncbi:MAG: complex I subunit 4 family protein [Candidatus Sericytochromatia bacterium]